MKQRIITGWGFRRALYLIAGLFIIAEAVMEKQWLFLIAGVYFAAMGLLGFGCAAGNCGSGYKTQTNEYTEPHYEEIKNDK
jgi:hypothetical protein